MAMKMKREEWHKLPRSVRLASVLYPNLVSDERRAQMKQFARNEGKLAPQDAQQRGYVSPYSQWKGKRWR